MIGIQPSHWIYEVPLLRDDQGTCEAIDCGIKYKMHVEVFYLMTRELSMGDTSQSHGI